MSVYKYVVGISVYKYVVGMSVYKYFVGMSVYKYVVGMSVYKGNNGHLLISTIIGGNLTKITRDVVLHCPYHHLLSICIFYGCVS
jgi:hypothetical protein